MGCLTTCLRIVSIVAVLVSGCLSTGCTSGAYVEVSAARALRTIADQMRLSIGEYHADLAEADRQRQALAVQAFISRAIESAEDRAQMVAHGGVLIEALGKLQMDQSVAVDRYVNTLHNIDVLEATADGLKHHGLARLNLGQSIQDLLTIKE